MALTIPNLAVGDKVKTTNGLKTGGKVNFIACYAATKAGGKTCSKKNCPHAAKEYAWVEWGDGKEFSYSFTELEIDSSIQNELVKSEIKKEKEESPKEFMSKLIKEKLASKENPNVIPDDQLDFNAYNGFKKSRSYRKKSI